MRCRLGCTQIQNGPKEWKKVQMRLPILHIELAKLDTALEKIKPQ